MNEKPVLFIKMVNIKKKKSSSLLNVKTFQKCKLTSRGADLVCSFAQRQKIDFHCLNDNKLIILHQCFKHQANKPSLNKDGGRCNIGESGVMLV